MKQTVQHNERNFLMITVCEDQGPPSAGGSPGGSQQYYGHKDPAEELGVGMLLGRRVWGSCLISAESLRRWEQYELG